MAQDMIVSLDPIVEGEILVKNVSGDFLDRVVKDVVIYVTDPSADGSNPGYNETERGVASKIRGWMEKAENNPGVYKFLLKAANKQGGDGIPLDLANRLGSYSDQILLERVITAGGNPTTKSGIDLFAKLDRVSGLYLPTPYIIRPIQTR